MTVAQLKRLVIPGAKLDLVHFNGWAPGPRTVTKSNSVGFALTDANGKTSHCDWPKASELIDKPNGFAIRCEWSWNERGPDGALIHRTGPVELLTYTFVS